MLTIPLFCLLLSFASNIVCVGIKEIDRKGMECAPDLMPRELTPAKAEDEEEENLRDSRRMSEGFSEEEWATMMTMENASSTPSTPFVERMAVLDTILSAIEDKQSTSGSSIHSHRSARRSSPPTTPSSLEKHCKAAEEVLEETETKGSLLERVSSLEKKVALLTKSIQRILYYLYTSSNNDVVTLVSPSPLAGRSTEMHSDGHPLDPSLGKQQQLRIAQPENEDDEGSKLDDGDEGSKLDPQLECTPTEKVTALEKIQKQDQRRWWLTADNFLLLIGYGLFFGLYKMKYS